LALLARALARKPQPEEGRRVLSARQEEPMNLRQFGVLAITLDFVGVTGWAIAEHGFVGLFETLLSTPASIATAFDLTLALAVAVGWTWRDARQRGESGWPWAIATALLGSPGVLVYLLRRLRLAPA
jgi:hypothetical protein